MAKILEQWNTKTAGGSGKLSVSDFELIQDPIHIQERNYSALEIIDLIGRITNNRSDSGPIVGTPKSIAVANTGDTSGLTVFAPGQGEVWELDAASVTHSGGAGSSIRTRLLLIDSTNGGEVEIGDESVASNTVPFDPKGNYGPVRLTSDVVLKMKVTGTTGGDEETSTVNIAVSRVR
jgi:hypothetical protein